MLVPPQMQNFRQLFIGSLSALLISLTSYGQDLPAQDSITQINVKLLGIFNQRLPIKYKIRNIKVVGNQFFDENLLLSLSTLNIGDEVILPGGDNFAKAIHKLMDQNYFSDVSIYLTDLNDKEIDVEIAVQSNDEDYLEEVDFNLEELTDSEPLVIRKRDNIYYEMYKEAKKKARNARDLALSAYLEAKRIKNTYMLEDIEDESDDSDESEGSDESDDSGSDSDDNDEDDAIGTSS